MKDVWKRYFRDIILKRGADYALSDCVSDLKRDGLGWTAVVHGSKDYDVEIEMEDDEILYMSCTCPYADGDHYCKHMAAVLFQWEADKYQCVPTLRATRSPAAITSS